LRSSAFVLPTPAFRDFLFFESIKAPVSSSAGRGFLFDSRLASGVSTQAYYVKQAAQRILARDAQRLRDEIHKREVFKAAIDATGNVRRLRSPPPF
jgi:hypothetical protein